MHLIKTKLTLTFAILVTFMTACNLPFSGSVEPTDTPVEPTASPAPEATSAPDTAPEPTDTPTATPTGFPGGGGAGGGSGSGDPEPGDPGEPGDGDDGTGGAAGGLDPCLVGLWAVDNDSMAQYMATALNQGGEVDYFAVTEITGGLFLSFDENGKMVVSSENYLIKILFAPDANLQVDMEMVLEAAGSADYTADGQTITGTNQDYVSTGIPLDSVLTAVSEGDGGIVMQVDPSWFLATVSIDSDDPQSGEYECSGDTLFLTSNPNGPVQFNRVE